MNICMFYVPLYETFSWDGEMLGNGGTVGMLADLGTPNPPTNIVPTNIIARIKLSGEIPRKSLWAWEFHRFKLTLCLSQALRNPQC